MALSYVDFTGDNSTVTYAFAFPYIDTAHVVVTFDDVAQTGLTFPTTQSVTVPVAAGTGVKVRVKRVTPKTRLVDFENGSRLRESDLDKDSLQCIYIAEEVQDLADEVNVLAKANATLLAGAGFTTPTTGDAGKTLVVNSAEDAFQLVPAQQNPNLIINGDFRVWQRDRLENGIPDGHISADRWKWRREGAASEVFINVSEQFTPPTPAESGHASDLALQHIVLGFDSVVDADNVASVQYTMEGYDYSAIRDNTATLSFWVKSSLVTGTFCVAFQNAAKDRSYVVEYTIDASDTWQKQVITLDFDSDGTFASNEDAALIISFVVQAGTNFHTASPNTWVSADRIATANQTNGLGVNGNAVSLSQVKLEKGPAATPFTIGTFAEELAKCQRYFYTTYLFNDKLGDPNTEESAIVTRVNDTSTRLAEMQRILPVHMRDTPTVTWYSPVTGTADRVRNVGSAADETVSSTADAGESSTGVPVMSVAPDFQEYIAHVACDAEF